MDLSHPLNCFNFRSRETGVCSHLIAMLNIQSGNLFIKGQLTYPNTEKEGDVKLGKDD